MGDLFEIKVDVEEDIESFKNSLINITKDLKLSLEEKKSIRKIEKEDEQEEKEKYNIKKDDFLKKDNFNGMF